MIRKIGKGCLGCLGLAIGLLAFTYIVGENSISRTNAAATATASALPIPTSLPPTVTPTPLDTTKYFRTWDSSQTVPLPTAYSQFPSYLESVLPPEAKGCVENLSTSPSSHVYHCVYTLGGNEVFPQVIAKESSRDFISAAYDTTLPITAVSIAIWSFDHKAYLLVGLGGNVAATQPKSTWMDFSVGPTNFLRWIESEGPVTDTKHPENDVFASGPWS